MRPWTEAGDWKFVEGWGQTLNFSPGRLPSLRLLEFSKQVKEGRQARFLLGVTQRSVTCPKQRLSQLLGVFLM